MRAMIPATSSGSSRSFIAVYPDKSLNSTVAWRRSPSGTGLGVGVETAAGVGGGGGGDSCTATGLERSWPHLLQNLKRASSGCPQLGHCNASLEPHSTQKAEFGGLSAWHFKHFMGYPAGPAGWGADCRTRYQVKGETAIVCRGRAQGKKHPRLGFNANPGAVLGTAALLSRIDRGSRIHVLYITGLAEIGRPR